MSTTVNYKGNTIATLSNETKTLTTAGTWVEDNIVLTDKGSTENTYQDQEGYVVLENDGNAVQRWDLTEIANREYCTEITGPLVLTCTNVYPYQFYGCNCTSISSETLISTRAPNGQGAYAFAECPNLTTVYIPNYYGINSGGYHFWKCTKLTDVYMPKTLTGQHMFDGCTSLVRIAIPNERGTNGASDLNSYGFANCTKLEKIDLGKIAKINSCEFQNCSKFNVLVLRRSDAITTLGNINAFQNTCFASGKSGGTIYAPENLIETYKAATNWSTIHGYGTVTWTKLEGSEYENYYVDGRAVIIP